MNKVLIHRYDNKPDILAVVENGCSDVYKRSRDDHFEYVVIIPTGAARTDVAVVAEATSQQYTPTEQKIWPGRPDGYHIRVDVTNIRYTTVDKIRAELKRVGKTWAAQWQVTTATIDLENTR